MFSRHCYLSRNIRHVSLYRLVGTAGIAGASCITFAVANVVKPFFACKALSPWDVYSPQLTEANFATGEISLPPLWRN
jgi:hypothetical protein